MDARQTFEAYAFGLDTQVLATDSVILRERDVTAAINAVHDEPEGGDVLRGLRYGLLFSAILWAALVAGGLLLFL